MYEPQSHNEMAGIIHRDAEQKYTELTFLPLKSVKI